MMAMLKASTLLFASLTACSSAWVIPSRVAAPPLSMNLLDSFFQSDNDLQSVESLPYGDPILPVSSEPQVVALAERGLSFTGEDFDVVTVPSNQPVCRVRGAMLHLPRKDKMTLIDSETGQAAAILDRKLIAISPTYDIYRGDKKIAWIEKVVVAFRDTFEVHLEDAPKIGPFKPPAAFKLEGDFLDRTFTMKTDKGETVARVSKDGWFPQFDAFNHYQISVAPGMDVGLVTACACAIDEEFDEEHQKRAQQEKEDGGGSWFG